MLTVPLPAVDTRRELLGERTVHSGKVLAIESERRTPAHVEADYCPESERMSTYDVDFDEFFIQHLLDEVVACVEEARAVRLGEIERV